jgi:hypothetical protein
LSPALAFNETLHLAHLIINAYCIDPAKKNSFTFLHTLGHNRPDEATIQFEYQRLRRTSLNDCYSTSKLTPSLPQSGLHRPVGFGADGAITYFSNREGCPDLNILLASGRKKLA